MIKKIISIPHVVLLSSIVLVSCIFFYTTTYSQDVEASFSGALFPTNQQNIPGFEHILPVISPMTRTISGALIPEIKSRTYLLGNAETAQVIKGAYIHMSVPIGSLTKLMTAVVAQEHFPPDDEVLISKAAVGLEGAKLGIHSGESYALKELMTATLIHSGNDGALAMAEHAQSGSGQFISWMNRKAMDLGMFDSHFSNPMGFDDPQNYSSAYDLFLLTRYIVSVHPEMVSMVDKREYLLTSLQGKKYTVKTTNALLGSFLPMKGMKTGTTEEAGASFIAYAAEEKGPALIAIVLASPDRFQEAKTLLWWGFQK